MSERVAGVVTRQGQDISALLNEVADAHGFPPRLIVACAIMESNLDEHSERYGAWPDVSAGLFHQTVAYADGFALGNGQNTPDNIEYVFYVLKTDLTQAARIAATQLGHWWGLYGDGPEALGRYNWPARGLQGNPNRANILRGWEQSARYVETEAHVGRTYDPTIPTELQQQSWACAIRTTTWLLKSLGFAVEAGALQGEMVPALVTPDLGLLDGSGAQLATWLRARFGVDATHERDVSWEWVRTHAGRGPVGLGSHGAYHWMAARYLDDDGTVALANPAPNWQGIGSWLTEAEFDTWAPWSGVFIAVAAPPEEEDDMARVAELETQLGEMGRIVKEILIPETDALLQIPRLPKAARDKVAFGIRPALATIRRLGAPEGED